MNLNYYITRLSDNASVIESLAQGVVNEQARWKPSPVEWSILEVVNHLYDEEREDFRARLDFLLHHSEQALSPIDPPKWAIERKYNERKLGESVERFLEERSKSVKWLRGLRKPDWESVIGRPRGVLRAGDILASWVAHDFLHLRQLARLQWQYLNFLSAPYKTDYAGEW
jgi:hypothetical protein